VTDFLLVGITQYTTKEHIARATIEATCFQTKAILHAMEKDSGTALHTLAVDGGMSNSDVCMQVCSTKKSNSTSKIWWLIIGLATSRHYGYAKKTQSTPLWSC
jgi:hypothetical protein